MTDEPDNELPDVELEGGDVHVGEGSLMLFDADYADPACEAIGALGIWYPGEGVPHVLIGRGEGDGYVQVWRQIGAFEDVRPKRKAPLKVVSPD